MDEEELTSLQDFPTQSDTSCNITVSLLGLVSPSESLTKSKRSSTSLFKILNMILSYPAYFGNFTFEIKFSFLN